jgi:small GTP-binding protein
MSESQQQAKQTLTQILQHWIRISVSHPSLVQPELMGLQKIQTRLEQRRLSIAAFGMVNRGKSAVLNALLQENLLEVGPLNGVTRHPQTVIWNLQDPEHPFQVQLIDTPGLNEVGGEARAQLSWAIAQSADLILFVIAGDINQIEYQALLELRTLQKPILLVFNKIDLYPDTDRQAIYDQITSPRLRQLVSPEEIVMVAAAPKPVKVRVHWPDNKITYEWERPQPILDQLRQKLQTILKTEGDDLIALTALLGASQYQEALVAKQIQANEKRSQHLLWQWITVTGLWVGLNPVGLGDIAGGVLADLGLFFSLTRLYGLPLQQIPTLLKRIGIATGILALLEGGVGLFSVQWPLDPWILYLSQGGLEGLEVSIGLYWVAQMIPLALKEMRELPKGIIRSLLDRLEPLSILRRLRQEVLSTLQR